MRGTIMMIFFGLGVLLEILGGLGVAGLFIYGVYTLFTVSVGNGFMLIGAAVVAGWIVSIVAGLLRAMGTAAAVIGTDNSEGT